MHICKIAYGAQVLVTQSCLTLCDCMEPTRLLSLWNSPSKNTGVGSYALLQGIFLTQGLNPSLLYWQADSLPLSYQESPEILFLTR